MFGCFIIIAQSVIISGLLTNLFVDSALSLIQRWKFGYQTNRFPSETNAAPQEEGI